LGRLALGLTVVYYFIWHYKFTTELKQFTKDEGISPGLTTFSVIIPLWNYFTFYQTGERVGSAQQQAGLQVTVQSILGLLAGIGAGLHVMYYQSEFNKVLDAARSGGAIGSDGPSGQPNVPPPPPA
jgi:hypothetical protein